MISYKLIISFLIISAFSLSSWCQVSIDSLKAFSANAKNDSLKADTYNQISVLYLSDDLDSSLLYAKKAFDISSKRNAFLLKANASLNMGEAYFKKNQYVLSLQYLNDALRLFKSAESVFGEAKTLFNISRVYQNIYKYDQSIKYGLESLNLFERIANENYLLQLRNHLANNYMLIEDYKTAEKYLDEFESDDADSLLQMQYYIRLGDLFLNGKSDFPKSIDYYNIALLYANNLNDLNEISRINNQLGSIYTRQGEYDTALYYLYEGYSYYNKLKSKTLQKLSYEYLIDYYLRTENYKYAYDYSVLLSQLKDSIFTLETNTKLAEFEVLYGILKREDEITTLEDSRQIMRLRIAFLSVMVVLVILLVFYIRRYYKDKIEKQHKVQLKLKNELELKDQELANNALNLAKNYELLNRTSNQLVKSQEKFGKIGHEDVQQIIKDLENQVSTDSFNEFEMRFLKVHENFYEKLMADHPLLSPNDLRICALLRLNLSSKDIAKIMHMSSPSVNVSRSRIRKKMNMPKEVNLVTFLMEY
jgi:DNA-binding CsgD family transcriptional regulator